MTNVDMILTKKISEIYIMKMFEFLNGQSAFLWVPTLFLFLLSCSFIRTKQASC